MISLKKSLDDLDELNVLFRASLKCYLSAIESMGAYAAKVSRENVSEHRRNLKQISRAVTDNPSPRILEESRALLERECRRYGERAADFFSKKESEIRKILEILAEATNALTERSELHATQFRGLTRELESLSELDNLSLLRKRLTAGVAQLKSHIESMRHDDYASVARMRLQLHTFRRRLEEAQTLAATDPLTGLANRREAEKLIGSKIQDGRPFCVMLFDLDGFKSINDRHGHHVGDQILKTFASRLSGQYRHGDVVCRWGGDEFLVVLSSTMPDAIGRAADVAERLRGLYTVDSTQGRVSLYVSASVGVAHHESGESVGDLFARADAFLYQDKAAKLTAGARL